jgi:hypothetical protein
LSPYEFARAATVRGFLEEDPNAPWLTKVTDDEPWTREVVATASARVHLEESARHWFRLFCTSDDLDDAWAAFRLFLSVTDRRCWLWIRDELDKAEPRNRKRAFLELNTETVQGACRENEKKLTESFLGCKVNDGLAPWME